MLDLLPDKRGGRPPKTDMREVLNAIFYVLKTGCQWAMLPHDFPPHKTVYDYFYKLNKQGVWLLILDQLRRQARVQAGREAEPSIVVLDSQSVKTTEKGGVVAMTRTR